MKATDKKHRPAARTQVAALLIAALCTACPASFKKTPHDSLYQKAKQPVPHPMPQKRLSVSDWWDYGLHSTVLPLGRTLSPSRYADQIIGPRPALDINAFGKVPDSTWFENRITKRRFSAEDIKRGPNVLGPPAAGALTVLAGKTEGATPGLVLRDKSGATWFVKFDPPQFRELSTSAEMVASRFMHAAGYFVPETYVQELETRRLQLDESATTRDSYNRVVPLTRKRLDALIALMNPNSRGELRTVFSRSVPGTLLGPFSYRGIRSNDPNDRIPHQRRRSLRGMWVLAAWLNNTDVRRQNTIDTFVKLKGAKGKGFIRHYMIDFGDSLGASGNREKYVGEGYEARLDWSEMGFRALALGLYYPYWLKIKRSPYRSVGVFESKVFDPGDWHPVVENTAFLEAGRGDTFWGASILARFTPDLIRAAVETAEYNEAGAAAWVERILIERREKVLRYAFAGIMPVDEPVVRNGYRLCLTDLAVLGGLKTSPRYHWQVRWNRTGRGDIVLAKSETAEPCVDLRAVVRTAITKHGRAFENQPFMTARISYGAGPATEIHLRAVRDFVLPIGMRRDGE